MTTNPTYRRAAAQAGFTLIELMITVAIVAVLAAVAVYGYARYLRNSRIIEAREMLGQIEMRQEAYYEANGTYCYASGGLTAFHPAVGGAFERKAWAPPAGWNQLGVRVDNGQVFFSYLVVAGVLANNYNLAGVASTLGIPNNNQPWYYAIARGDMDGKGAPDTELRVTSVRSEPVILNEGN